MAREKKARARKNLIQSKQAHMNLNLKQKKLEAADQSGLEN